MSRIPEKFVPDGVLVTDNGGPNNGGTHDRFTVTLPNGDCYSMSTNVMADSGVCTLQGTGCKHDPNEQKRDRVPLHVYQKIQELS